MKAIILKGQGLNLDIGEFPIPKDEMGQSVLKISCAALNHRDVWIKKGLYANLSYPIIPGSDGCGYLGDQLKIINPGFSWGDLESYQSKSFQILGMPLHGTMAEFVSVPDNQVFDAPEHLTSTQAAAIGLAGVTAYRALVSKCKPQEGENLLVSGIGGGVALFVLQFGLALGLNVYVTSSDQEKINQAIALGAKGGVLYTSQDFESELKTMNKEGFDIIVDGAGGSQFSTLIKSLNPGGRISIYGGTRGKIDGLSPQVLFWKQISIFGSTMGSPQDFENMLVLINTKSIIPVIDHVYSMDQVNEAFDRMDSGKQFGKIVIRISQ